MEVTTTHYIKLKLEFCDAVNDGRKPFEIRYNDRNYRVKDYIVFNPETASGWVNHPVAYKKFVITSILEGWGLEKGYVCLGIKDSNLGD